MEMEVDTRPILAVVKDLLIDGPGKKLANTAIETMGLFVGHHLTDCKCQEWGLDIWEGAVVHWKHVLPEVERFYREHLAMVFYPNNLEIPFIEAALKGYEQYGEEVGNFWKEEENNVTNI